MFSLAGSSEEESEEEEPEAPPPQSTSVQKTPRVYEAEAKEPDLTKQPKKSALKKTPVNYNIQAKKSAGDSIVHTNFSTPVARDSPPPETVTNAMPSPKATPVNQGPPKPKPRITLLRWV